MLILVSTSYFSIHTLFTSVLCGPVDEEIHCSDLSDLLLLSVKPEDLLAALLCCLALNGDGRPIVTDEKSRGI